jgi:hypothetical protein
MFRMLGISLCRPSSEQGRERQAVARRHPQTLQSRDEKRVAEKRKVLGAWAVELGRIIGEPAAAECLLRPERRR